MVIKDKQFELFIESTVIQSKVGEIASFINQEYSGKNPLFVAVLNGSFIFAADLLRWITIDCELTFIKVASYSKMESTGNVKELIGLNENLFKRDVIILEDIIDSGKTIENLVTKLNELGPNSIEIATLLIKRDNFTSGMDLKYVGFEIPDKFVVGYGLDYDGYGRNLKDIYQLK